MSKKVSIIDYGVGNILSVKRAFEFCGAQVEVINTKEQITNAEVLVLPGVGAFKNAMYELIERDLKDSIIEFSDTNKPMLGICLGMQLLLEKSEEFGETNGLGIIQGEVVRIEDTTISGNYQKIPHVGWNSLKFPKHGDKSLWDKTILNGLAEGEDVYFVHSFTAKPTNNENRLADSYYGGRTVSAAIKKGNVYGCQFHPEKSGEVGLKIIKNFLEI
ncbi:MULTISPECIES: imidazole glycerol phosphate synthase subunit HisH [unclassified Clostridium]|uniref:imidazole glycerol phosphate synthase subunit HisH n=1 Tax=unclassified Clostridium TaxID=2614128 RepID=UPI000297C747|nr:MULTISPECIES: imidazole glycerol phosphate synthase subunit HisH [unclassified Clostridium]EKQ51123.1 MAG: imidazole glycerol phosphate synthase, glutamine amidotransferase subunit [Clostridium sp. Maddingley MBC34-26]